jgi:peptide/nickel transport system permease protein
MLTWVAKRCLWMLPTLIGITFVVFLVLDLAPVDRASFEMAQSEQPGAMDVDKRAVALARLRIRYGLVDPVTLEPVPVHQRYLRWLGNAVQLRLAGDDEDQATFRGRFVSALPATLLLGFWAVLLAFSLGVPIGAWLGMRHGGRADRVASWTLFVGAGLPEVLVATLLLLTFGAVGLGWLPTVGLRGEGAPSLGLGAQIVDLAAHMLLPVMVLTLGPLLLVVRFVRESVRRTAASAFARNLDAWGIEASICRRRLLRVGFAPVATLVGTIVPMVVTGSVVVESVFSIDGVGRLVWDAVQTQDQAMVMAVTLLVSVVTLLAMMLSDLLHQLLDPRVRVAS